MTQFVRKSLRLTNGPAILNKQKSLAGSSLTLPGWKSWLPGVLTGVLLHTAGNKFVEFITPWRRCRQEIEMDSRRAGHIYK